MNFGSHKPSLPILDLAPLIDVVFLLLIFFMVSTELGRPLAMPIALPEAHSIQSAANESKRLVIDENGAMILDENVLGPNWEKELKNQLQTVNRIEPIQIAADQLTPHYFVVQAMDVLSGLGFSQLQIVARETP